MPDGGEHARPSIGDELTRLEIFLAGRITDTTSIRVLVNQAGVPPGFIDLHGEPADQWHVAVRKCEERDRLEMLFELLQERMRGAEHEKELYQLIEAIRRKRTPFEARIKGDLDAVRNGLRVVLELSNPMDGVTKLREIRSALTTLVSQLDEEDAMAIVIVSVTREEALNIRERIVRACLDVISAVDKLLGIPRLRDEPNVSGELLRYSGDEVVLAERQLAAALDARNLVILRGRRLLQLAAESLLAATGRAEAGPPVAGPSSASKGPTPV